MDCQLIVAHALLRAASALVPMPGYPRSEVGKQC
jgi:hypothetical protein